MALVFALAKVKQTVIHIDCSTFDFFAEQHNEIIIGERPILILIEDRYRNLTGKNAWSHFGIVV